jgi:hypothetical protein
LTSVDAERRKLAGMQPLSTVDIANRWQPLTGDNSSLVTKW